MLFRVVLVAILHGWVALVNREAVRPDPGRVAALFFALFIAVVVLRAKRLKLAVVEQVQIAFVGPDVVGHGRRG